MEPKDQQGWGRGLGWPGAPGSMEAVVWEVIFSLFPLFPEISLHLSEAMAVQLLSENCGVSRCRGMTTTGG